MTKIATGRILWGVSFKLASNGMQCVAEWFTEPSEARGAKATYERLAEPGPCQVYADVRMMCIRLPDAYSQDELQKLTQKID